MVTKTFNIIYALMLKNIGAFFNIMLFQKCHLIFLKIHVILRKSKGVIKNMLEKINAFKIDSNLIIAYTDQFIPGPIKISLILNQTKEEIYYSTGDNLFSAFEKLLEDCNDVSEKCQQFLDDLENNNYKIKKTNNSGWFPKEEEADDNLLSSLFNFSNKNVEIVLMYDEKNKYYLATVEEIKEVNEGEKEVIVSSEYSPILNNNITFPDISSGNINLLKIDDTCETLFLSIGSKSKEETLNYLKSMIFKLGAYMEKIEKKGYDLAIGAESCKDKVELNDFLEIKYRCYKEMFNNCSTFVGGI